MRRPLHEPPTSRSRSSTGCGAAVSEAYAKTGADTPSWPDPGPIGTRPRRGPTRAAWTPCASTVPSRRVCAPGSRCGPTWERPRSASSTPTRRGPGPTARRRRGRVSAWSSRPGRLPCAWSWPRPWSTVTISASTSGSRTRWDRRCCCRRSRTAAATRATPARRTPGVPRRRVLTVARGGVVHARRSSRDDATRTLDGWQTSNRRRHPLARRARATPADVRRWQGATWV